MGGRGMSGTSSGGNSTGINTQKGGGGGSKAFKPYTIPSYSRASVDKMPASKVRELYLMQTVNSVAKYHSGATREQVTERTLKLDMPTIAQMRKKLKKNATKK